MTNKTKIALAAALIAAFASPALARDNGRHHNRYEQSRVIEGRNAAVYGDFGGTYSGTSTGRDALVQTPGN
jgi:hypothetical protein